MSGLSCGLRYKFRSQLALAAEFILPNDLDASLGSLPAPRRTGNRAATGNDARTVDETAVEPSVQPGRQEPVTASAAFSAEQQQGFGAASEEDRPFPALKCSRRFETWDDDGGLKMPFTVLPPRHASAQRIDAAKEREMQRKAEWATLMEAAEAEAMGDALAVEAAELVSRALGSDSARSPLSPEGEARLDDRLINF